MSSLGHERLPAAESGNTTASTCATTCCVPGGIIALYVGEVKDRTRIGAQADNRMCTVATEGSGFCIHCGARLEAAHRFCWHCGLARWEGEPGPAPGGLDD